MMAPTDSKGNLLHINQNLSMVEMGNEDIVMSCTYGKISVEWRKKSRELIEKVLFTIANIDPYIQYEFETLCDYDEIPLYESRGLILVSYACLLYTSPSPRD